jgi:hypothetical protein
VHRMVGTSKHNNYGNDYTGTKTKFNEMLKVDL